MSVALILSIENYPSVLIMRVSRLLSQPLYKSVVACLLLAGLAACNSVQPSQTTSGGGNTADVDIGQSDQKTDSDSEEPSETENTLN